MNTVIVPVDFSETSINASHYAVKLLSGIIGVEMILYHSYEKEKEKAESEEKLSSLKEELLKDGVVNITTMADPADDFVEELEKLARHRNVDFVIMGITGRSALAQIFVGSNTLKLAENKFCPVMIVPSNAEYRELKNVLLASDLQNAVDATPSGPIKKLLKVFKPKLHIMNVNDAHYIALTEKFEAEQKGLKDMFAEFNPEFYFLRLYDVDDAIHEFVDDENIDLIITVQREHSLLHKYFKTSHTRKLAYKSSVPVFVVHE